MSDGILSDAELRDAYDAAMAGEGWYETPDVEGLRAVQAAVRRGVAEEAARIADSVGHHWSGQPAHAAFEAATAIREQLGAQQ